MLETWQWQWIAGSRSESTGSVGRVVSPLAFQITGRRLENDDGCRAVPQVAGTRQADSTLQEHNEQAGVCFTVPDRIFASVRRLGDVRESRKRFFCAV